jgi:hypothetical protein
MEYETLNQINAAELLDVSEDGMPLDLGEFNLPEEFDGGAIRGCMFAILFTFDWYMLIMNCWHARVLLW